MKLNFLFAEVNLIHCGERDELTAGALNLHYITHSKINIKQIKVSICPAKDANL